MEAIITLEYDDNESAAAIALAVSPDNFKTPPGLNVKTEQKGLKVVTEIHIEGKIATFIATVDDLLESVSTAERTLRVLKSK